MTDVLKVNTRLLYTVLGIVALVGGAVIGVTQAWASDRERLTAMEKRITTLEDKVQWQNDVLWEIRGDLKVVKERGR
jgi:hypothetical protein